MNFTINWQNKFTCKFFFSTHKACNDRQKPNIITTFNLQSYIRTPLRIHCSSIEIQSTTFNFYITLHWDAKKNSQSELKNRDQSAGTSMTPQIPWIQKIIKTPKTEILEARNQTHRTSLKLQLAITESSLLKAQILQISTKCSHWARLNCKTPQTQLSHIKYHALLKKYWDRILNFSLATEKRKEN